MFHLIINTTKNTKIWTTMDKLFQPKSTQSINSENKPKKRNLLRENWHKNINNKVSANVHILQSDQRLHLLALKQAIESISEKDIILYINEDETIFNNSIDCIVNNFIKENIDILFSAEMNESTSTSTPTNNDNNSLTNHTSISSLGFIGYKHAIYECLSWKNHLTDENYLTEYFLENNKSSRIALDTNTKLFLNMHLVNWKEILLKNGKIYNRILETTPCIVNFNLNSYISNTGENIIPFFLEKIEESLSVHLPLSINKYEPSYTPIKQLSESYVFNHTDETKQTLANIDKIIYINLDKRTDRCEYIEDELYRYGLLDISERFSAIETPGQGILGTTYSHLEVYKIAKERKYKNVLILEDDFLFLVNKEELYNTLQKLFDSHVKYDVCMLAYNNNEPPLKTEYDFLMKTVESATASAYLINESIYDKLIELYEWAAPLLKETGYHWMYANDQVWKELQKDPTINWYCFKERLGKQLDGYSDNSEEYMELMEN